jgi:hypothetical protein
MFGIDDARVTVNSSFNDFEENHEASEYLVKNYKSLLRIIYKKGITDKAYDLLDDVYISLKLSEENNEGFDAERLKKDGSNATVESFVQGRISLYCKNVKYSNMYVETYAGKDENITVIAATPEEGNEDSDSGNNTNIQLAMKNASVVDSSVEEFITLNSVRAQIDTCIDIGNIRGLDMLSFFKNIDKIAELMTHMNKKDNIFDKLKDVIANNSDFEASLMDVMQFRQDHKDIFNTIIASY